MITPNRRQRRIDAGINKRGLHNTGKGNLLLVDKKSKHILSYQKIGSKTIQHLTEL